MEVLLDLPDESLRVLEGAPNREENIVQPDIGSIQYLLP